MGYVIGMDGGGTKTIAVIADETGAVKASASAGPTNPNVLSSETLKTTIRHLYHQLQQQAPGAYEKVETVFAGISGAGREETQHMVMKIITNHLSSSTDIQVVPDSINALYTGTFGKPGIVQIAGTGSITYGINKENEHRRVGGWGFLFGDTGSGYDLGRRAIIAVLEAEDSVGERTVLKELLFEYFHVQNARELIEKVYAAQSPRREISSLSKIVFQAYKKNDLITVGFINEVVKNISSHIQSVYTQLFQYQERVPVVLVGGLFSDTTILPSLLENELKCTPTLTIYLPKLSPVGGSVIGGLLMQKVQINKTIIKQIKHSLSK